MKSYAELKTEFEAEKRKRLETGNKMTDLCKGFVLLAGMLKGALADGGKR